MESGKDGDVGGRGEQSDQCGAESALGKLAKRGAEHVFMVEGIQKKAENRMRKGGLEEMQLTR